MDFTQRIDVPADMDTAIDAITKALKDEGFGVLTRIDVQDTLEQKLHVDVGAQVILGACNPQLAHRALEADPRVAALLPCNVVVRADGDHTIIEALDPKLIASIPENDSLLPVAEEAGTRIRAALDAVVDTLGAL